MEIEKRKVGRPRKPVAAGSRASLGLKVTPEIKAKIAQASDASGRTQSQEAEFRIESSFDRQDLLPDTMRLSFGGLSAILLLQANVMERAGRLAAWNDTKDPEVWSNESWLSNPQAWDAAVKAANAVLEATRPPGKVLDRAPPFNVAEMIAAYIKPGAGSSAPRHAHYIAAMMDSPTSKRYRAWLAGMLSAKGSAHS